MTSPLTNLTPERAKELRALAKRMSDLNLEGAAVALREYATLIDTVLDGGDVVTDEVLETARKAYWNVHGAAPTDISRLHAALTAALRAAELSAQESKPVAWQEVVSEMQSYAGGAVRVFGDRLAALAAPSVSAQDARVEKMFAAISTSDDFTAEAAHKAFVGVKAQDASPKEPKQTP